MASVLENYGSRYFFEHYLKYREHTEAPAVFHRWALVSALGTLLERNFYIRHGDGFLYPNQYVMFLGTPGTRKSSAIKGIRKFMVGTGFDNFAAERTSKEKFLMDLAGDNEVDETGTPIEQADQMLGFANKNPACVAVHADEFNDFAGLGNIEFLSILSSLWDYSGLYKQRLKNSKSIEIQDPTISILAGNTPTGFTLAFPPESNGQGVLSRMILIHGADTGKKIAFPTPPDPVDTQLIQGMMDIAKLRCTEECTIDEAARELLTNIYKTWKPIEDPRFANYSTRRFTHLLKLCLICVAARVAVDFTLKEPTHVTTEDVVYANSMLVAAEYDMPKALGEYGRSKQSAIMQTILEQLRSHTLPLTVKDLLKLVSRDLEKPNDFPAIMASLVNSGQIQSVEFKTLKNETAMGYAVVNKARIHKEDGKFDLSLLFEFQ